MTMPSTEFFITALVVVLVPGTGVIYTVSTGLFRGWRASLAAALGCTAGIVPHLLASIMGLSAILHVSAVAFQVAKLIGAVYLLYLAWMMWRETGGLQLDAQQIHRKVSRIIIRGVLINILNPKLSIFFLAFLPQFISPDSAVPMLQMFVLSGVFMVMTLVCFILYGICAARLRTYVIHSPRILQNLQRSFAAVFAILGLKLAVTEP